MSNAKVVMGQAANTLVKPLEVEDVFSTYLYDGHMALHKRSPTALTLMAKVVWFGLKREYNSGSELVHMY